MVEYLQESNEELVGGKLSCQDTTSNDGQTEFQFFQQIAHNTFDCCGPMNRIGFTKSSLAALSVGLDKLELPENFLDNFDPVTVDSTTESYSMCTNHWIQFAKHLGNVAISAEHEPLAQLAYYIFRVVCLSNEWDYREILNYLKTINNIKEK